MPKVSILVPIYNVEKYLKQCLDSIINQTLKDIEIICINDGSTDNSSQILNTYTNDKRIKIINKENSGYGASMNKGLKLATGEYIGIVESDDFIKPNMYEELYKLAKEKNLDIAKSDFYYYYTSTNQSRIAGKIKKTLTNKIFNVKNEPNILSIQPSIWSAIYKKELLQEHNIQFLETAGASYQDTSFSFKAFASAERIAFTSQEYLFYRQDNVNSSINSPNKIFCICEEWEEITRYINSNPKLKEIINQTKLSTQFNIYRWNVLRLAPSLRNIFIEKYQETFNQYLLNGELEDKFYQNINKNEFTILLNDKKEYRKLIDKIALKQIEKQKRHNNFSIRINSSRISIILFGKQILEMLF